MTRFIEIDDAALRALERHQARAHAIPAREVRDLGHAIALIDPRDPDPFWNRVASVRWPGDPVGFDRHLGEMLALFAVADRRPHVWPSPAHGRPVDLAGRLAAHGFRDIGGGHLMVLDVPAACGPVRPSEAGSGVSLHAIRRAADLGSTDAEDAGMVLAESFGAAPGRGLELAADIRLALQDPRLALVLVRVDGEPAAVAKAASFDGLTFVSSVGTRAAFRGRGLAGLATRQAIALGGGSTDRVYLGVSSGNTSALRLYGRLGFASLGESPDLLLA